MNCFLNSATNFIIVILKTFALRITEKKTPKNKKLGRKIRKKKVHSDL